MANPDLAKLDAIAREGRVQIIRMLTHAGSGHPGGSLSVIDILVDLYFNRMRYNPRRPTWEDRDRFVLSKGHCVPAQYFCMAKAGFFPESLLLTLRKLGSPLQGHPDRVALPGIEAATGSLGQGLSVCCGMALGSRMDGNPRRKGGMGDISPADDCDCEKLSHQVFWSISCHNFAAINNSDTATSHAYFWQNVR